MKRWLAVLAGGFGVVAYIRGRRRWQPVPVPPADELRAKLAESRAAAEPEPEAAPEPAPDRVGERRQDVHDRARAAIDELG